MEGEVAAHLRRRRGLSAKRDLRPRSLGKDKVPLGGELLRRRRPQHAGKPRAGSPNRQSRAVSTGPQGALPIAASKLLLDLGPGSLSEPSLVTASKSSSG